MASKEWASSYDENTVDLKKLQYFLKFDLNMINKNIKDGQVQLNDQIIK